MSNHKAERALEILKLMDDCGFLDFSEHDESTGTNTCLACSAEAKYCKIPECAPDCPKRLAKELLATGD